jgi:Sulfatase
MDKLKSILSSRPFFVFLLPMFFVLHGFTENFGFIPVKDTFLLFAVYLGVSFVLVLVSWLLFKNIYKACLAAFCVMCLQFFFGGVHDTLKKIFPGTFIIKYSFLIPATFVFFLFFIICLKKRKKPLLKITLYLNFLFLFLLLIDGGWLFSKMFSRKQNSLLPDKELSKCDSCARPDIYFILADEYAGYTELKDIFHYDNSAFENELKNKGFHIIENSYSNYNYTPFSLASILNMEYLHLKDTGRTGVDLLYSYQQIKKSTVIRFLEANGYRTYNFSIFDFEGQPAPIRETFLPARTRLITSQTFLSRLQRDLWFHTITLFKSKKAIRDLTYDNQKNNQHLYQLTWNIAGQKTVQPKFVYTHLMMPHYPYYFNENGNELPFERLVEGNQHNKNDYIGYLRYSNKKILELLDHIQKSSATPPIIILMGDHGFRHFTGPVERKYYFMNLSSVYFPDRNYAGFRDSMSTVNLFRVILNNRFHQKLYWLPDSTIYLRD